MERSIKVKWQLRWVIYGKGNGIGVQCARAATKSFLCPVMSMSD